MSKKHETSEQLSTKDWVPVKNIVSGIVMLKDGTYLKIMEIIPINFNLKSKVDRRMLILNYRAFLKACRFPMQISIQCKKADVDPHIRRIQKFIDTEKNPNIKSMIQGYIKLVSSLSYGVKGAISRRFFLIFPYIPVVGVKKFTFADVEKQLEEKAIRIKEFLGQCGNEVVNSHDNEWVANVLYTCLNKKTSEYQRFSGKLEHLTGLCVNSALEEGEDDE